MGVETARCARRAFLLVAVLTATIVVGAMRPGAAAAASPPPTPGISQYVETVPTSSGGTTNQPQKTTERARPAVTPAQVAAIASSPAYGAPQSKLSLHPAHGTSTGTASREDANAISAAVSAVDGSDDSRFIWLAVALVVITASAVGAATLSYRRRP
jgi:cobalamin biosynthesis Mg chelatase CobN